MRAAVILFSILFILGCDREPVVVVVPAPATQPAPAPASAPAATLPALSVFWIDQQRYEFPPMLLEIEVLGDALAVELMTDNPPEVEVDSYKGNSLFLPMSIEAPAGGSLDGAKWEFKASNSERAETIAGIQLRGRRKVLQPFDVVVTITGTGAVVGIELRGTFLMFDDENPQAPPQRASVMAELIAPVRWRGPAPEAKSAAPAAPL